MTIAPTVGELVPGWVYEGKFPEGDEAAMVQLSQAWSKQAESNTAQAEELTHAMDALSETYSGPAARAANQSAEKTRKWLETGAAGCTSLSEACTAASVLITATKVAMNVVLLSLQVSTQKILKAEGGNLLDVAGKLIKIRQVQIAAQAQIDALSRALVTKLGELAPEVDIKPELPKPKSLLLPGLGDNAANPIGYADGPDGSKVGGNVPMENGFPDISDIVGADDATAAMDENGTTPGMSPGAGTPGQGGDGLHNASDSALSDEERDELYEEAVDALEDGDASPYDESGLYEDAEQVDPDAIPDTVYDNQPGTEPGEANPDGMAPEQILGEDPTERPDPVIPSEDFEGDGPGPGTEDGPPAPIYDAPPPSEDQSPGSDGTGSDHSGSGHGSDEPPSGYDPTPSRPSPADPTPSPAPGNNRTPWSPPPPQPDTPTYPPPGDHGGGNDSGGGSHHNPPRPSYDPPAPIESQPIAPPEEPGTSGAGVAPTAPVGNPGGPTAPPAGSGFNPGPGAGNHLGGGPGPGGSGVGGGSGLGGSGLGGSGLAGGSGGGLGGSAPAPSGPAVGGSVPPAGSVPSAPAPSAGQPSTAVPPTTTPPATTPPASTPPASTPPASTPPASTPQQGQPLPAKEVRIPDSRAPLAGTDPNPASSPDRTDAIGALIGAGLVAGGLGLTALWADLGRPAPSSGPSPGGQRYLPTQFGREDVLLAALPAGMAETYQRALVPGEADAFLTGVITTVRGLVHPYDQVRDLQTPAALIDTLGLGFGVLTGSGSTELAFDRGADHLDVIRFNGLRPEDLVVPVAPDVVPPVDATIPYVVRQHTEPWTGSGEAPGSTLDHTIEEYEILGTATVAIPHLAEIWRIGADGEERHVSSFNARSGTWTGAGAIQPLPGRVLENGLYAQTPDGMAHQVVTLTEHEHVLIARGLSAPEYFLPADDGSARWIAGTDELLALVGVTSLANWRGAKVQMLRREAEHCLVDYAGPAPAQAAALGFRQLNQGQWAPQWVTYADLTDQHEVEREYPLPEPAEQVEEILSGRPVAPPPAPRPAG